MNASRLCVSVWRLKDVASLKSHDDQYCLCVARLLLLPLVQTPHLFAL